MGEFVYRLVIGVIAIVASISHGIDTGLSVLIVAALWDISAEIRIK